MKQNDRLEKISKLETSLLATSRACKETAELLEQAFDSLRVQLEAESYDTVDEAMRARELRFIDEKSEE